MIIFQLYFQLWCHKYPISTNPLVFNEKKSSNWEKFTQNLTIQGGSKICTSIDSSYYHNLFRTFEKLQGNKIIIVETQIYIFSKHTKPIT